MFNRQTGLAVRFRRKNWWHKKGNKIVIIVNMRSLTRAKSNL